MLTKMLVYCVPNQSRVNPRDNEGELQSSQLLRLLVVVFVTVRNVAEWSSMSASGSMYRTFGSARSSFTSRGVRAAVNPSTAPRNSLSDSPPKSSAFDLMESMYAAFRTTTM